MHLRSVKLVSMLHGFLSYQEKKKIKIKERSKEALSLSTLLHHTKRMIKLNHHVSPLTTIYSNRLILVNLAPTLHSLTSWCKTMEYVFWDHFKATKDRRKLFYVEQMECNLMFPDGS